jgi:hypothetical protein
MLFATTDGGAVRVDSPAPKRQAPVISDATLAYARAETFERYIAKGFTVGTIANVFRLSERTIHADLRSLREERERRDLLGLEPLARLGV